MTIEHAESYLARLREESEKRKRPTKRAAEKLAKESYFYVKRFHANPPWAWWTPQIVHWGMFRAGVYHEHLRLRAIAEGRKP